MAKEIEGLSEDQIALLEGEGLDMDTIEAPAAEEKAPETAPEAPAEAEAAPEVETPTEETNAAEQAPPGYVPTQALREAREEARANREALREMQQWQAAIATKLAEQRAMGQQPLPDEPQIPNAETDPVESIAWTQKQVQEMQAAQAQREEAYQQQYQAQQQQAQVFNMANTEFLAAAESDPELQQAYDHARASYAQEVQMLGAKPTEIEQKLNDFALGFAANYVNNARRQGVPITDYVKTIAKARGWQPAPAKSTAEETIERQAKAQTAAQTLSKTGTGSGETTLQDLAGMSGEELEVFALKNPELFAKLSG